MWKTNGKRGFAGGYKNLGACGECVSSCLGDIAATTKIDRDMSEFIDGEAERLGISKAEFHRRLLEFYRDSQREKMDCPHCDEAVVMDLVEE